MPLTADWLAGFERHAIAATLASELHGPRHWRTVARVALLLRDEGARGALDVVLAFAAVHDCKRISDGSDYQHAIEAMRLVEKLAREDAWPLNDDQTESLAAAVYYHDKGVVTEHPTVGWCFDADRLCLWRVGNKPVPGLLSTAAGRSLIDRAELRALLGAADVAWHEIVGSANKDQLDELAA